MLLPPTFPAAEGKRNLGIADRLFCARSDWTAGTDRKPRPSSGTLRRTYASLRHAVGDDPITVAEQGGRADPSVPMKVYAKAVRRRNGLSGAYLEAFDKALDWAAMCSEAVSDGSCNDGDPRSEALKPRPRAKSSNPGR